MSAVPDQLRTAAFATGVCAAVALSTAVPALAESPSRTVLRHPWSAQVQSPSDLEVLHGRSVRVVVRTGPAVRSFRASLGGQAVRGAFRGEVGTKRRVAVLVVGRTAGLRWGTNTLRIRTADGRGHRWFAEARFVVARRVEGELRGVATKPTGGHRVRASATVRRARHRLEVLVNGGRPRPVAGGLRRAATLDADDGLRPGRNVVRVRATDRKRGRVTTTSRRVVLPRRAAVAGAGPSRRAGIGQPARFTAAASVMPKRGQRPRYRWTVAARPKGAHAQVKNANAVRPTLRADQPGHYRLRVRVSGAGRPAVATTRLAATAASEPAGLSISTSAYDGSHFGVRLGEEGQAGYQFFAVPDQDEPLQLLVLDRSTLAEVSNSSFGDDVDGANQLFAAVKDLPSSDLVIITRFESDDSTTDAYKTVLKALAGIGVGPVPVADVVGTGCDSSHCSVFSAIGVPGIPVGQGDVNAGMIGLKEQSNDALPGALTGYLREDLTARNFTFVDDERVPVDTGDPGAKPATVSVGSDETGSPFPLARYTSDALDGPGFLVVVLDAGSLALEQQGTFSATTADGLQDMHAMLDGLSDREEPPLVIVRSVGAVARPASGPSQFPWDAVALDLRALGGSQYTFESLGTGTNASFAQVGPGGADGYTDSSTQVATPLGSGGGRVTALLARNGRFQMAPRESYVPGGDSPLAGSLAGLLSMDYQAWPARDGEGKQNVLDCIAAHIDSGGPLNTPIEDNYTNKYLRDNWSGWAVDISADGYEQKLSSEADCGPFTTDDFAAVEVQLQKEWEALPSVWELIAGLQAPLIDGKGNAAEFGSIANNVNDDVGTGPQTVTWKGYTVITDLLGIAGDIPVASDFAAPFNVLVGAFSVASEFHKKQDGSDASAQITTTATDLTAALSEQYATEVGGFRAQGDLLVSDWFKLSNAARNAQNLKNAAGDWKDSSNAYDRAGDTLLFATRRLAYKTFFPELYALYRLQTGTGSQGNLSDVHSYTCTKTIETGRAAKPYTFSPFGGVAEPLGSSSPVVSGDRLREFWTYAGPGDSFVRVLNAKTVFPPQKLLAAMFSDPHAEAPGGGPLFAPLEFALSTFDDAQSDGTKYVTRTNEPSNDDNDNYCIVN